MKWLVMLWFVGLVGWTHAQEPSRRGAAMEKVSVRGADIAGIELDTQTGKLSFSVGEKRYVLPGNAEGFEGVAAAKLGILSELRKCDQLTMSVVPLESSSQQWIIKTLVLKYDALKP